jgi:hypothetical protein
MDARNKTSLRLLTLGCLLLLAVVASGAGQGRPRGSLYVIPTVGRCSETVLPLELDGINPPPSEVELRVKRSDDDRNVIAQRLTLDNGTYRWSGLLVPLGKYKAQLYDASDSAALLGEFTFNNIDILKDFITRERGEIVTITRGGGEAEAGDQGVDAGRGSLSLDNLPKPDGGNRIHVIVMNGRGNRADEYYGPPPANGRWSSKPLLAGNYKLIVVEYGGDGNCRIIRGG